MTKEQIRRRMVLQVSEKSLLSCDVAGRPRYTGINKLCSIHSSFLLTASSQLLYSVNEVVKQQNS